MSEIIDCISWIVQKTCWSFYVFLKFLFLRLLDLLGLIFNIAACLTIVRLPCMIGQFANLEDIEEWRFVGFVQVIIFIADIPVMISGAFLTVTIYRMFPLCEELREKGCKWDWEKKNSSDIYFSGWKPRRIILKHFFLLIVDTLFLPACVLCICSWRCVMFVRSLKEESDPWERRKKCFFHLFNLFLDIPCIILGIICMLSWRMPFIVRRWYEIYKDDHDSFDWNQERWYAFLHFGILLVDIPCAVCFMVSIFTWRVPFLIRKLKEIEIFVDTGEWKLKKLAVAQFLLIFVDLPCIVCALFVLLTGWRFPFFVQDCKKAFKKDKRRQWRIRKAAILQFGMLFIDVGCLILALIIFVTLWRAYPLIKKLKKIFMIKESKNDKATNTTSKVLEAAEEKGGEDSVSATDASHIATADSGAETQIPGEVGSIDDEELFTKEADDVNVGFESHNSRELTDSESQGLNKMECETKRDVDELAWVNITEDLPETASNVELNFQRESEENVSSDAVEKKFNRGWKIRKAICVQFAWLLFDIPAMPCFFLLVITLVRLPRVLSTFLQSADIYTEFAITVYFQTLILFADLLFSLLFLVLVIIRPVECWIRLLEDEEHMKWRLLCFHMQWIPDVVGKRNKIHEELNELISVHLKRYSSPDQFQVSVKKIFDCYFDELKTIRDRMKKDDLDPDYIHLIDMVLWWEDKRIDKAYRQYTCESNFLLRPDATLRKKNQEQLRREQQIYDIKVSEQYSALKSFVPEKVPLWTVSTGFSTRSRKETQKVLINCLPRGNIFLFFLTLFCCLPLYRAPKLLKCLFTHWYDRAAIILKTLKEYGLDFLTFLRIFLVLIFIYRAPALIADISIDIVEKQSWSAVRKTVKKYPLYIWEDCISLVTTILSWKTPRFLFTAMLFGVLMPADMFLSASKFCTKNLCLAYLLSGALYLIFVSFPFIMSFYVGEKLLEIGLGWVSIPVTCAYVGLLLIILGFMVVAFVRNTESTLLVPKVSDYFHFNWYNMNVIVMEVLEFLQLLALVFSFADIPMYGGDFLHQASKYLLFSFISFDFKLGIGIAMFFIWFFLSAAPVIFEQILEDLPEGTCKNHSGWRMAISLFANTLFVTMTECFASCFSCTYVKCPSGVSYKSLSPNSSCFQAALTDNIEYYCWRDVHRVVAMFGLFAFLWYATTSFLVGVQFGDPGNKKQDVEFSPTYNVIANFIKAVMVVAVVVITSNKFAVLGVLIACNVCLIMYTILFKTVFKYKPSNYIGFVVWRVTSFCAGTIAAVAVVIAYVMNDQNNKIPLIIFGSATLVVLLIAAIGSIILKKRGIFDESRDRFKNRLLALEERLYEQKMLLSSWKGQQRSWKHLVHGVREARRDDQLYKEADWAFLKAQVIRSDTIETLPDESVVVPSTIDDPMKMAGEVVVSNWAPQAPPAITLETTNSPILTSGLPPPPNYGSAAKTDEPDVGPVYEQVQDQITVSPFNNPLMSLERNGVNLLLVLEQSILYKAYAYSFLAQRSVWLTSVSLSNWVGLDHCFAVLEQSLDYSFEKPSSLDVSLGPKSLVSDIIEPDVRDSDNPPSYVPESRDPDVIEANSANERRKALIDVAHIAQFGGQWKELMDRILPNLPVVKEWFYDGDSGRYEIQLRRSVTATIKDVGPDGIKLAKGATFRLGKLTCGFIIGNSINFRKGCEPVASKGPIQLAISDLKIIWKKGTWYLESQGKSVKYAVALDSIKVLEWK